MFKAAKLLLVIAVTVCVVFSVFVEVSVAESLPGMGLTGGVDWRDAVITGVGIADPAAEPMGRTDGQRLALARTTADRVASVILLETIVGIEMERISEQEALVTTKDVIRSMVRGTLKNAVIVNEGINELGLYEVTKAIRISDLPAKVRSGLEKEVDDVRRHTSGIRDKLKGMRYRHVYKYNLAYLGLEADTTTETGTSRGEASDKRSGARTAPDPLGTWLIIDARDVEGFLRSRGPVVYSEEGKEVYRGWEPLYYSDLLTAIKDTGATSHISVEARGMKETGEETSSNLVIGSKDAVFLTEKNREKHFFDRNRVIILVKK